MKVGAPGSRRRRKQLKALARGRARFVLLYGVGVYGCSAFLFSNAIDWLLSKDQDITDIAFSGLIWLLAGLGMGLWSWRKLNNEVAGLDHRDSEP